MNNQKSISWPCAIVALVGLPASGKTTLVNQLQQYFKNHLIFSHNCFIKIIDTDIIRKELFGTKFDPHKEEQVLQQKRHLIQNSIANNTILLIDDMHYYVSMRHELYQLARETRSLYFSIAVETPLEKCFEWNKNRGYTIPNSVIADVAAKFDPMGLKYRWDNPDYVLDLSQVTLTTEILSLGALIMEKWQLILNSNKNFNNIDSMSEIQSQKSKAQMWDQLSRKMVSYIMTDNQLNLLTQEILHDLYQKKGISLKNSAGLILAGERKKFFQWLKDEPKRGDNIENLITMIQCFHEFLKNQD